jgi:type I restriction enzyme S subunit
VRLKDVAVINRAALSEDTDGDRVFSYVDIGCVDSIGRVAGPEEVRFADAPSRARRLVGRGDSIVSTVRTYLRAIAHIGDGAEDLIVSTGFATLTPRFGVHPRFLYWALRSNSFVEEVVARSVGVSYPAITATELASLAIPLPSADDQRRIADFLDSETARIDELIAEQELQLQLLAEHRHAVVSEAVGARIGGGTSGLVGALNALPDDWRLVPLRYVAKIQSGLTLGKSYEGPTEQRPYLRVANVQDGALDLSEVTTVAVPRNVAQRCELRDGDVLMTEGGDNDKLGRGTIWRAELTGCLHQNHVFAVRPDRRLLHTDYLALLTASSWGRGYFTATAHQTTNLAATNRAKMGRFPLPLPEIAEQQRILGELGERTLRVDDMTSELSHQINLLREHRQSVITSTVIDCTDPLAGTA